MATPVYDTFTDTAGTDIAAHTPDVGGTWVKHPAYSVRLLISNASRCRKDNVGAQACYYNATDPGSDDYVVSATVKYMGVSAAPYLGLVGRVDPVTTTMYHARYYESGNVWQLYKILPGTALQLGEWSETLSAGDERVCELDMTGTTISVRIAGITRISVTDSSITARGYAGMRDGSAVGGTDTNGIHLDNFTVTNSLTDGTYPAWSRRASGIWTPGRR